MFMKIGYARVSTTDQSLDLQLDALKEAGCDRIFKDHGLSGKNTNRAGFCNAMAALKDGDTLIVWRLDRLARSMRDLTNTIETLHERGIAFQSISEKFDVSSAFGELALHILGAIAHFERELIAERTRAGMIAAKERGVKFGRPRAIDENMLRKASTMVADGRRIPDVAKSIGVGTSTLYKCLAAATA